MPGPPTRVILVTDGDRTAQAAVEVAAAQLGLRCISASAGNSTRLDGEALVALIRSAPLDPVVVMVDDRGLSGPAAGEQALAYIAAHPEVEVLGVVAVAAGTPDRGIPVDCSVTAGGQVIPGPVDKEGRPRPGALLCGDTVGTLRRFQVPVVVGMGDPGKVGGADRPDRGAYLTTLALAEVLRRAGVRPR